MELELELGRKGGRRGGKRDEVEEKKSNRPKEENRRQEEDGEAQTARYRRSTPPYHTPWNSSQSYIVTHLQIHKEYINSIHT